MKAVISLASMLAVAFSLNAQITVTLNQLPDHSEVRIRNNAVGSLTAFAISAQWKVVGDVDGRLSKLLNADIPKKLYADSLVDTAATLLPRNEERGLEWGAPRLRATALSSPRAVLGEPISSAGILEDGTTTGDTALLRLLLMRRSNMLLAVDTALETLSEAGKHNVPPGWLIGQFRRLSLSRFYLPPEQEVGRSLYESILGKLINLPDEPLGSPFPPTAFVEKETAELRQRRTALVESRPNLEDAARSW